MTGRPLALPADGIRGEGLLLRTQTEDDIPALVEALQDPEIARWTRVPHPYREEDARWWLDEDRRLAAAGEGLHALICEEHGGPVLGSIGLNHIDWQEARCELGYLLRKDRRGEGIMTRAVRVFSAWVFAELPFERLAILVEPPNRASRRVAELAGFTAEGVLRSWAVIKDTRRDFVCYSLLRGELR